MNTLNRLLLFAVPLSLAACGGSSGSSTSTPPPSQSQTVIDSNNAEAVGGRSMNAAFQSGGYGGGAGAGFITFDGGAFSKPSSAGGAINQIPIGPETTPCAVSGATTVTGEIDNPLTITPGDFFNIDWDNCNDGVGVILDGLLGTTFTSFDGDVASGAWLLGMSLRVDNFLATAGNEFNSAHGDIAATVDTMTPMLTVATSSGTLFTVGSNASTETLRNFSSTVTENTAMLPSLITTTASGAITSTQFEGEVTYSTPVTFESLGDAYPYVGELLVTGANNATLRLIALDEVNVRIIADYDGDGATDETIDTTWEALAPRIDIPVL